VYFGFDEEFKDDRGITRINFPGGGVFFLAYFISLTKAEEGKKLSWLFILFLGVGFVVTIMQVTRQSIALLAVITGYHLIRTGSIQRIAIVLGLAGAVLFFFLFSDSSISKGLMETQKQTVAEGSQYIRVLAAEYFAFDFSPNVLAQIFGNGYPNNISNYGRYTILMQENYGFYIADVGLIGFYAMFGILPVIAYVIIFVKGFRSSLPDEQIYLKYYLFFLLITSLTSDYTYSINFLITNVFVFYMLQINYEEQFERD
jgi:hypothetical protein